MKRLLVLLLAVLLLVPLAACGEKDDTDQQTVSVGTKDDTRETTAYETIKTEPTVSVSGYTPIVSRYSYDALPLEGEKRLYDELVDVYYDISPERSDEADKYAMPEVTLKGYSLSEAQVRTTLKAIEDDRPEVFWASGTIGYYSDEEETIVQVYSRYSADEVNTRLKAVHDAADAFYKTVPEDLSEYERELFVHDYLADLTEYDENVDINNTDNNDPNIYTVYGALVDRVAVCEGYARTFQMLLNGVGVDCIGVTGTSDDQLHMWNEVKLGNSWYAVDVTWDDRKESFSRYCYFNLTTEHIERDHDTSKLFTEMSDDEITGAYEGVNADVMNLFVPECTDATMSYYYQKTPHLSDYESDDFVQALTETASNKEQYFVFYVEDSLDYDEALNALFSESPQYFFDYVDKANDNLQDFSIDTSNLSYVQLDENRAVAVELNYL